MKKLTLNLDDLEVHSFGVTERVRKNGTVQGHDRAWSDDSVCPTTAPSDNRPCHDPE